MTTIQTTYWKGEHRVLFSLRSKRVERCRLPVDFEDGVDSKEVVGL